MSLLTAEDARAFLKIPESANVADSDLNTVISEAQAAIEDRVGPISPTTVTARVRVAYGASAMVLPLVPVLTLTSVTSATAGAPLDLTGFYVSPAGVVYPPDGAQWPYGSPGGWSVVYTAGRDPVPPSLQRAVKQMLKHLWDQQRGGASGTRSGNAAPDPEWKDLPPRIEQMIRPFVSFGFA